MHAGDGLVDDRRRIEVSLEVAVHADPVHFAAAVDLVLTDDRNVVLGLAGNRAGVAARAGREVDRHPPRVTLIRVARIQRKRSCDPSLGRREIRFLLVVGHRRPPQQITALERVVLLRNGHDLAVAGLAHRNARADPGTRGISKLVGVESDFVADLSHARTAVAEVNQQRFIRLARHNPGRSGHRVCQLYQLAVRYAVLGGGRRTHHHGVVPGKLRQRPWQFLEPGVVREAAVADHRAGAEQQLLPRRTWRRQTRRPVPCGAPLFWPRESIRPRRRRGCSSARSRRSSEWWRRVARASIPSPRHARHVRSCRAARRSLQSVACLRTAARSAAAKSEIEPS